MLFSSIDLSTDTSLSDKTMVLHKPSIAQHRLYKNLDTVLHIYCYTYNCENKEKCLVFDYNSGYLWWGDTGFYKNRPREYELCYVHTIAVYYDSDMSSDSWAYNKSENKLA